MSVAPDKGPNWVRTVTWIAPDLSDRLLGAGIKDEESYLALEHLLPRRARSLTAQIRRDLLVLSKVPLETLLDASPPWLLDAPLSELGLSREICEKMTARVVRDLAGSGAAPEDAHETDILRLALYRAGAGMAPGKAREQKVPGDRVMTLLETAPAQVLAMNLVEIPLPTRVERAFRNEGYVTLADIANKPDASFKMLPYFGEKSLEDLLACLQAVVSASVEEAAKREELEACP